MLEGIWKGDDGDIMLVTCAVGNNVRPMWSPSLQTYMETFPDYLIEFEMLEGLAGPGGSRAFVQRFPRRESKEILYLYALGSDKKEGVVTAVYALSSFLYRFYANRDPRPWTIKDFDRYLANNS